MCSCWGEQDSCAETLNVGLLHDQQFRPPACTPEQMESKDLKPFTAAAPTAAERWETAPVSGRWVNKLRSMHTVDSGSVSERKEVLTPAAAQRGTADTLGEIASHGRESAA